MAAQEEQERNIPVGKMEDNGTISRRERHLFAGPIMESFELKMNVLHATENTIKVKIENLQEQLAKIQQEKEHLKQQHLRFIALQRKVMSLEVQPDELRDVLENMEGLE